MFMVKIIIQWIENTVSSGTGNEIGIKTVTYRSFFKISSSYYEKKTMPK